MDSKGQIVIYDTREKGNEAIEVKLEHETIWLTQKQMADLFGKDSDTISDHIQQIYKSGELSLKATTGKFPVVQKEGNRSINRNLTHYNLDVIISVGYRVSSIKGTQFRIWATKILRDHIVKGFTINKQRIQENTKRLEELQEAITLIEKAEDFKKLSGEEASGLLTIITEYTKSWILINKYDHDELQLKKTTDTKWILEYHDCIMAIDQLRNELKQEEEISNLFGSEIEDRFKAIIGNINQSLYDKEVYPTIEEKASHLLYFVIKDHPFSDGNKRIASMLFIYFLKMNDFLYKQDGEDKINDNTLIALALLVAVSNPNDKNNIIKLITNILN